MFACKLIPSFACKIGKIAFTIADVVRPHAGALVDLGLRIWVALIFWKSGVLKIDSWESTLMLFEYEHPVPYLSPEIAAYLGTFNELVMPFLLVIGFGTRIAALALIFATAIIQYTYLNSNEHFIWALVLLIITIRGAGLYSIDYFLREKCKCLVSLPDVGKASYAVALAVVSIITFISLHEALAIVSEDTNAWLDGMLEYWNSIGKK
jgi:putative oxidoreductase